MSFARLSSKLLIRIQTVFLVPQKLLQPIPTVYRAIRFVLIRIGIHSFIDSVALNGNRIAISKCRGIAQHSHE